MGGMLDIVEAALAAHGGPYLLGERYSIVDPYLLMLSRWTRYLAHPARCRPHLGCYLQRIVTRQAVQRAFAGEGLAAPFYG